MITVKEIIPTIVDILMSIVLFITKILGLLFKYILFPISKFLLFIGGAIYDIIKQFCTYSLSTYGNYGYILVVPLIAIIVYVAINGISKAKDIITGGWNYGNDEEDEEEEDDGRQMVLWTPPRDRFEPVEPRYSQMAINKPNEPVEKPQIRKYTSVEKPKCVFCNGPATVGPGCGFSPYKSKIHASAPDGKHCVYCGGEGVGVGIGCGFSPTKTHSRVLIY